MSRARPAKSPAPWLGRAHAVLRSRALAVYPGVHAKSDGAGALGQARPHCGRPLRGAQPYRSSDQSGEPAFAPGRLVGVGTIPGVAILRFSCLCRTADGRPTCTRQGRRQAPAAGSGMANSWGRGSGGHALNPWRTASGRYARPSAAVRPDPHYAVDSIRHSAWAWAD